METTKKIPESSFFHFIMKEKANRAYLLIALSGTLIEFIVFKLLYPFPDFFSDSYSYIYAAQAHLDVSIWPIGYSKFLAVFHVLTHSDTTLIAFQYFFLELSALWFFFSILYFFSPGRIATNLIFAFLFFNPLFLYISNYVNSDPLFAALSLLWFTQLLWIIHRPAWYQVFIHAVLLFLCFTIRNNSYYYPFVGLVAFLLSRQRTGIKLAGVGLPLLLIIPFVIHTRNAAYKMTGTKQFSLFTGWQLSNNALYMYDDISVDPDDLSSVSSRELDTLAKKFYQRIKPDFHEYLGEYVGNFFIRQSQSPLKQYLLNHYHIQDEYSNVVAWGKASAVFNEYGSQVIRQNPVAYARSYMVLNAKNYFVPPLEKLGIYNLGTDNIWPAGVSWFDYESPKVSSVSKKAQGYILYVFPALWLVLNLYLVVCGVSILVKKKYKQANPDVNKSILLAGCFFVANFFFCIAATIIVFRYEFMPLIICFASSMLAMEFMDKKVMKPLAVNLKPSHA